MRGGVLRHYGGTALYACDDTVSLRMVEIPGENVGLGRRGCGCVHYSTDLPDRVVTGWYAVSVAECFYGLGGALLIVCLCYLLPASTPAPIPRLVPTSLNPTRFSFCLYLRLRYTCACPFPAGLACSPAFDRRSVAIPASWGGLCGVGPRVGTSKPTSPLRRRRRYLATYGFSTPKNTRIALGRRRVLPARIWGRPAVFLSNNHGQTIMVGLCLR